MKQKKFKRGQMVTWGGFAYMVAERSGEFYLINDCLESDPFAQFRYADGWHWVHHDEIYRMNQRGS